MSDTDHILDQSTDRPVREGGCPRRVAIWTAMIMCGLMIALILLSQPRVTERLRGTADYVSGRMDTLSYKSDGGPVLVAPMPSSQLPVRRGGAGN